MQEKALTPAGRCGRAWSSSRAALLALCSCPAALPAWEQGLTPQHQKAALALLAELAGKAQVLNRLLGEISVGVLSASFH